MKILFEQKKPGRTRQAIAPVEMHIEGRPTTVGELIEATVRCVVAGFNSRAALSPEDADSDTSAPAMDNARIADLAETGRVAFGIVYNGHPEDPDKAVANALQCYDDGLFRIFLNGTRSGWKGNDYRIERRRHAHSGTTHFARRQIMVDKQHENILDRHRKSTVW